MSSCVAQGSRMKPIYARDRSAICLEIPPLSGFCRVSAPLTSPKLPSHRIADLHAFALPRTRAIGRARAVPSLAPAIPAGGLGDKRPLVVDLDGTLVRSDLLIERALAELGRRPQTVLDLLAALS